MASVSDDRGLVAIVGSGIVGCAWACLFARAGYLVQLYDVQEAQVDKALSSICEAQLPGLAKAGLLWNQSVARVAARISRAQSLHTALEHAIYAQECAPENPELKKRIFKDIDDALKAVSNHRCIVGSSSSNIPPSHFTEGLHCSTRCLVSHPVNPPFAIPVVELVPSPWTSQETMTTARRLMDALGQAPVVLKKEVDGFIVNRLQYALLGECYRLVADDVCSPQDVDTAVSQGLGLRWSFMGPFQTIDLNAPGGVWDYHKRYTPSILRVIASQDNNRPWEDEVIRKVERALRQEVPEQSLGERVLWRNERLMQLAVHKQAQERPSGTSATTPSSNLLAALCAFGAGILVGANLVSQTS